ncbi:MAG: hypothetical protein H6573_07155 [Lewinellaceae bacterium]|nr:hypothetical protein [Lewinellaceae bacterium]
MGNICKINADPSLDPATSGIQQREGIYLSLGSEYNPIGQAGLCSE